MSEIAVRRAVRDDVNRLQIISRQTFIETYAAGNTEENMHRYLEDDFSIEQLTAELNDEHAQFYFANAGNSVIGYLKLNFGPSQTELKDDNAVEIERIYVLQAFQGKKVGQLLYEKALEIARKRNAEYIWLDVWEKNPRAISFYRKNGFSEFGKHVFKLGRDEQTDIMMRLPL